jgi:para-aminobenzoate synthetase component I
LTTVEKKAAIGNMNQWGAEGIPFLFIIDFEIKNVTVLRLGDAQKKGYFFDIQGITNYNYLKMKALPKTMTWEKKPLSLADYTKAFRMIQEGLHRGNSFLANLTCSTPLETNLDLAQIFHHSQAKYKLWKKDAFVCFSPEIFVKINAEGIIASYPMKGTIDAAIPDAKQLIMNDLKEKAEHNTIVDLIRNDLSKIAKKVTVTKFRYLDLLQTNEKNLYQVSSEIQGKLAHDWKENVGNILMQLLPAGSISGAPKKSTIELIQSAETYERGHYTGVFGFFDGKSLDSGVMIRFIEQDEQGKMHFKSGGGITVFSDLVTEYQELINKIYVPIPRNN